MIIPAEKKVLVDQTQEAVSDFEQQYADGLITKGEKYNKVVDAWSKCTDKVADAMMNEAAKPNETARGYARPHGQAVWRDYRNADYCQL